MNPSQNVLDRTTTAYRQQLYPWCIVQHLPNMQNHIVTRFRRRNDADDHLRVLRQRAPRIQYAIVFEPPKSKPLPSPVSSDI